MFKTAATKLAHNSTIPALAGKSDLKPLQEVIAAEKLVLQSFQRLSSDFGKSSDALRAWAGGEGEDLGDTFSACATLLTHWVSSLASFASHIAYVRECLKAVRTREEALDEMHRRRKSLTSKADSADKRLNKMGSENKNLRQQTDLLMGLRDQIRTLDVEVMNEEASLGDWKRTKAREWMGVLFGALLECSEKGAVVATFGRTIIGYVSTEKTQPGLPRAHYTGHSKVEPLVVEAERELHKITFVGEVGDESLQQSDEYHIGDIPGLPTSSPSSPVRSNPVHPFQPYASSTLPNNLPGNSNEVSDFGEYNPYSQPQTYAPGQRTRLSSFDQPPPTSPARSSPLVQYPPPQGGSGFTPGHKPRLSQSSVRSGAGFTPGYPSTTATALHPSHSSNNSASGFIPEHRPSPDDTFSSSIAKALGQGWDLDENGRRGPPRLSVDGPPPSYATNIPPSSPTNPQRPPYVVERKPVPVHVPEISDEDDEGVGLSYLNPANDDVHSHRSGEKHLGGSGNGFQEDRKVRWGSVRDADTELERRSAEGTRGSNEIRRSVSSARYPETASPAYRRSPSPPMPEPRLHVHQSTPVRATGSPTMTDESETLPNPNVSIEGEDSGQLDERSLNALAAREIGRQMEASSPLSPPSRPFAGRKSVSPRPSFTNEAPPHPTGGGLAGSPPPPPPPPAYFTNPTLARELAPSPELPPPPPRPVNTFAHSESTDSADDAYRTPPDYLRNPSTAPSPSVTPASLPQVPQVTPTLSSPPSTPTTTKKITAAAFRRQGMRALSSNTNLGDDSTRQDSLSVGFRPSPGRSPSRERGDGENRGGSPEMIVTPLNLRKKTLPAVPGISTDRLGGPRSLGASGTPRSISSPFPGLKPDEDQPHGPGKTFRSSNSPESRPRESMPGGDDDFDYLTPYLDEEENRQTGNPNANGMTNDHGRARGPGNNGYGSGRFTTRLED